MILNRTISFLNKPFLLFILAAISLAYLHPEIGANGGLLKPEITVKYGAIIVIFFISGVSLHTQDLVAATYQFRIHVFIQSFSMVLIPIIVVTFVHLVGQAYPKPEMLTGFVTVSCMPPPVSSAVLLTKKVGGNEAVAVFNSALGSFLGIFITPALLYILFSEAGDVPIKSAILQLGLTVVLPVIIGQCARQLIGSFCSRHKKELSVIGSFMLVLIIYTTFCETFSKRDGSFTIFTVIITTLTVILLQILLLTLAFYISNNALLHFTPEDTVAVLYCSTHKSLTLGFPILKILFGKEANFILISFPLLVYHPMQILIGSFLVPTLQNWIHTKKQVKGKFHFV